MQWNVDARSSKSFAMQKCALKCEIWLYGDT